MVEVHRTCVSIGSIAMVLELLRHNRITTARSTASTAARIQQTTPMPPSAVIVVAVVVAIAAVIVDVTVDSTVVVAVTVLVLVTGMVTVVVTVVIGIVTVVVLVTVKVVSDGV